MNIAKSKKGQLAMLSVVAVTFVVVSIVIGFGSKITQDVATDFGEVAGPGLNGTMVTAITSNGTQALGKLAKYLPLLALVVAAAIIIGLVMTSFGQKR
jgi:hypothetical protein